jgi:hypothetical protein
MLEFIELLIHFGTAVFKLLQRGGLKLVMAETIAMKQQLIVLNRLRKRPPSLVTSDRLLFGSLAVLISERRLQKAAVILRPAWSCCRNEKSQSVFRLWSHFDANIGVAYCRTFNEIKSVDPTPKYISYDNDPLFHFHRWQSHCNGLYELTVAAWIKKPHRTGRAGHLLIIFEQTQSIRGRTNWSTNVGWYLINIVRSGVH